MFSSRTIYRSSSSKSKNFEVKKGVCYLELPCVSIPASTVGDKGKILYRETGFLAISSVVFIDYLLHLMIVIEDYCNFFMLCNNF